MSKRILPILILLTTILLASCEGWTHPPTEISTPSWMWGDWLFSSFVDGEGGSAFNQINISQNDIILIWNNSKSSVSLADRIAEGDAYISGYEEADDSYRLELDVGSIQERISIDCTRGPDESTLIFEIMYPGQASYEAEYVAMPTGGA